MVPTCLLEYHVAPLGPSDRLFYSQPSASARRCKLLEILALGSRSAWHQKIFQECTSEVADAQPCLRNCDIEAATITSSGNAVFMADCCGNTELGWRRNQASEVTKNFAATELSLFSRRRSLPLRIPHLNEPQTVKYYLRPSDSDGCKLLLNNLFCPENEHFVEVKCVFCLRQSLLATELRYVSGKG